jgi:hypothetical protein
MPRQCECCHRDGETVQARGSETVEFDTWQQGTIRDRREADFRCDTCTSHPYPYYEQTPGGEILKCPVFQ